MLIIPVHVIILKSIRSLEYMRSIGYARVSRREQVTEGNSIEQQSARLSKAGATEIVIEVHSASSGTRPHFQKLCIDIAKGEIQEVIVTRLDRISRRLKESVEFIELVKKYNVNLKVLDENIDLSTSIGMFIAQLAGSLAEMEANRLSERVKHGWEYVRNNRLAVNPPFGYTTVGGVYVKDKREICSHIDSKITYTCEDIANYLINCFFKNHFLKRTIREYNLYFGIQLFVDPNKIIAGRKNRQPLIWSPTGLKRWLVSEVLRGHTVYNKTKKDRPTEIIYNTHPNERYLTEEQYQEILAIFERNSKIKFYGETKKRQPLAGLVKCAYCRAGCYTKSAVQRPPRTDTIFYFQCRLFAVRGCSHRKYTATTKIELYVVNKLWELYTKEVASIPVSNITRELDSKIEVLRTQIESLKNTLIYGDNESISNVIVSMEQELVFLEQQKVSGHSIRNERYKKLVLLFPLMNRFAYLTLDDTLKKNIYHSLVESVWIKEGECVGIDFIN